jgi:hypothetical protein
VRVTDRRRREDRAAFVREMADGRYKDAERLVPVVGRLDTHSPASPHEAFPPAEARRLPGRLGIHRTPKHGSRLDTAEVEPGVLARALPQRVADRAELERQVAARARRRNEAGARADWRFTTADARTKLRRLYPSLQD